MGSSKGGGQSGLEMLEERLGMVALRRELRGQLPGSLFWVILQKAGATILRQTTPL